MSSADQLIAYLPPISLAELLEAAALLKRTDRKYIVTEAQLADLLRVLAGDVRVLEIDGTRTFHYESTYFDTPGRDSFRAAAHRRRRRFKVRTRTYADTMQTYFEVKVRDARRRTVKLRLPYPFADRASLNAEAHAFVTRTLVEHGIPALAVDSLVPALRTAFHRSTMLVPSARCRVTVDTELRVSHPDGSELTIPDLIVLETKSDAQDRRVDRALWRMGVRPQSVSKFAIGSVLLDPDLPDNKWSRTIQRHFVSSSHGG